VAFVPADAVEALFGLAVSLGTGSRDAEHPKEPLCRAHGRAEQPGDVRCFGTAVVSPQELCSSLLPTHCEFRSQEEHLHGTTDPKTTCDRAAGSHAHASSNFGFVSH